jgi:PKD repeat protein
MSEPDDELTELTPLPDEPEDTKSKLSRSPFVALGVAALVVSTVFATVAALASTRDESAAPAPQSKDTIQTSTSETYTTDPVSTSVSGSPGKKPSKKSSATDTEDGTSSDEETTDEGTSTGGGGSDDGTTTRPGGTTTRPTTTTPAPKPPAAKFSSDCPDPGLGCSFDGSGSTDSDGSIVKYEWAFGDGKTATGETTSHTYTDPGTYTVKLTVTDDKGLKSTAELEVTVETPTATSGN